MANDGSNGSGADNNRPPPRAPREPPYVEYLYEIYRNRLLSGEKPVTSTDPDLLVEQARQAMTKADRCAAFGYIYGGAGTGSSMAANRRAFDTWGIIPRMMRPADPRDLRVRLFGETYFSPLIMAPVGVQSAYHADRELGTAAACAALDVPFCLSTASSSTIEEVADKVQEEADDQEGSPRLTRLWYQLYWPSDDEITASLLARARRAGYRVLVVTVDTFTIAWRPVDLDEGYLPFIGGEGNAVGFSDPVFRQKFADKIGEEEGDDTANTEQNEPSEDPKPTTPEGNVMLASMSWTAEAFPRSARSWADLRKLRSLWGDGPIVVKGVLHPEDALLAREHGADGVVVSNHGGRQVDGAVGALEMLPEVVAAVRKQEAQEEWKNGQRSTPFTILFDSGIRCGADIIKALCLGAEGVLVGRPVIYGLGVGGRDGAQHVLASLLADLDQTMNLIGAASVADLGQHMIRLKSTL